MELNKQQKSAAEYSGNNKHLLVLAGAGTGKTRTIIGRAIHLLRNNVPSKRIVLLTFTRRAASEMKHRMELELGETVKGIFAGTFHRFCLDTMKSVPRLFGVENSTIIDRDDQLSLVRLIRGGLRKEKEKFPHAARLIDLYSYSRNTEMNLREYLNKFSDYNDNIVDRIIELFELYEKRKKERNYLDFDDILYVFLETIRKNKRLKETLKGLFSHILVDEMQDTNPLQWGILENLANPAQLFCVGDDAQSIYAFRGADFKNVHSFKEKMPDSDIIRLELNYRSGQKTLDLANWLLNESDLEYNRDLKAFRGKGITPKLIEFYDNYDEARWIADDIISRKGNGQPYEDIMVLIRAAYLAREIEATFVEKEIPYVFIGGTALLRSAHVKDIISMLRAAENPKDELAWIRFLKCWPRIGDRTAANTVDALIRTNNYKNAIVELEKLFAWKPEIPDSVKDITDNLMNPFKAIQQARKHLEPLLSEKYDHWSARVRDLELFEKLAQKFTSVTEFIETYTLDPVYNKEIGPKENDDVVTLITIHSAKGTESPVCYIPTALPGVFPHIRSLGNEDSVEEERRILYVGMTRAIDELIITRGEGSGYNVYYGASALGDESNTKYFLNDIPEGLVDYQVDKTDDNPGFLDDLKDMF